MSTRDVNPYSGNRNYEKVEFEKFDPANDCTQHNIMFLVGNGFDISVLRRLSKVDDPETTRYADFFNYLATQDAFSEQNKIYQAMSYLQCKDSEIEDDDDPEKAKYENWSDLEQRLEELIDVSIKGSDPDCSGLLKDLDEMRLHFSAYLNHVVNPEILNDLDELTREKFWSYRTFGSFLGDLDKDDIESLSLPLKVGDYDVFNFNIVNFNFTSLLDNYLFLDSNQFDPKPYQSVDTNFVFRPNPRCPVVLHPKNRKDNQRDFLNSTTTYSSYLTSNLIHPHGFQSIPRSLLFGVDRGKDVQKSDPDRPFEKPFWAQSARRYEKLINETELFVIHGSSRGESDSWWWKRIVRALSAGVLKRYANKFGEEFAPRAELIIYEFVENLSKVNRKEKKEQIIESWLDCYYDEGVIEPLREEMQNCYIDSGFRPTVLSHKGIKERISKNIKVVLFDDSTKLHGFGFNDAAYPRKFRVVKKKNESLDNG